MKSRSIFSGKCISIHTITEQAEKFFVDLDEREQRDLRVAGAILDTSLAIGRPPGGRAERVAGSTAGLWELRVTPPGRRGPHTRALYICEQRALLVVRGVRKAQRGIPRRQIELADGEALTWQRRAGERSKTDNARGSP
jgi:Phage derived protein Gp49-like (DUF891)